MKPSTTVIVVGPARSGTTLLMQLLAIGYGLHAPYFEGLPEGDARTPRLVPGFAPGCVYKAPALVLGARETRVQWVNSGAKLLGIIRDPRSMATSRMRDVLYYGPDGWGGDLVARWTMAARSLKDDVASLPNQQGLVIRFEDLVQDVEQVQARITSWIGLRLRVPFSRAHEKMHPTGPAKMALNGVRPLDPSRAEDKVDMELPPAMRELMTIWGYTS